MIGILFIGLGIALALYFMLAKTWGDDSRKAKKQERAEIIRQLLALSDRENSISATPPPVRSRTPRTNQARQPAKLHRSRQGFVGSSTKS
jgi:hypothetical protein